MQAKTSPDSQSKEITMIEFDKVRAKISAITLRAEKHGQENVPSITIKFRLATTSKILDAFDPALRKLIFRKPGKDEPQAKPVKQGELDVGDAPAIDLDDLTALRLKRIPSFPWKEKFTGYELDIGSGLESTTPLLCDGVTVDAFTITPVDGGSVILDFNCGFQSDEMQTGKLSQMLQETVEITLRAPE
jgi:hypothetical protein